VEQRERNVESEIRMKRRREGAYKGERGTGNTRVRTHNTRALERTHIRPESAHEPAALASIPARSALLK
jgi:hypothetical protein